MFRPEDYPESPAVLVHESLHGKVIADPFRWLEDAHAPDVRDWLDRQDDFARHWLAEQSGHERLRGWFSAMMYLERTGVPREAGGRLFYLHQSAAAEKAVLMVREPDGSSGVLLDVTSLVTHGNVALGAYAPSPDGRLLAYALRPNAGDDATLHIRSVDTGEDLAHEKLLGARYARPQWLADSSGFYYVFLPEGPGISEQRRPGFAEVRLHLIGQPQSSDALIAPCTGNPGVFIGTQLSDDQSILFISHQHGWSRNDVWFRSAADPNGPLLPLSVDTDSLCSVDATGGFLYVLTWQESSSGRIFRVDPARSQRTDWIELVGEQPGTVISEMQLSDGCLLVVRMKDAHHQLESWDLTGRLLSTIPLPGMGTIGTLTGGAQLPNAYFDFSGFMNPGQVLKLRPSTGALEVWFRQEFPLRMPAHVVEQVYFSSRDGTRVPMFIVRPADMPLDGSTPFILTGYGGFNKCELPYFATGMLPWLAAGGAYAIPNLRGGGEFGESWHRAGMLDNKENTFDDFIAAAEFLIEKGYTSSARLAVRGGSNGGLLVGAFMVRRPDLARAVVCAVPLLDMLRYHLFGAGRTWIPEYGSAEDPHQFETLYRYSPYHHLQPETSYPALLMLTADHDDRVDPMHARKFTALAQQCSSSGLPILLRLEREAGHGGADRIYSYVDQAADIFAFLMSILSMRLPYAHTEALEP